MSTLKFRMDCPPLNIELYEVWRNRNGRELLLRIIIIIIISANIIVITSFHFIRHKIDQEAKDDNNSLRRTTQ